MAKLSPAWNLAFTLQSESSSQIRPSASLEKDPQVSKHDSVSKHTEHMG